MYRQPFRGDYPISLHYGEECEGLYKPGEHKGVDYLCPVGTPILASEDGKVKAVSYQPEGYGNYIIIEHPDMGGTVYAHLEHVLVMRGDNVKRGQQIATSGASGYVTGPHLHFEMRTQADKISTAYDPLLKLQNVLDLDPIITTPATVKPEFKPVEEGLCVVVCDVANVRCHCDLSRVIKTVRRGEQVYVSDVVVTYNGLPYRKYFDMQYMCFLMIAEHDPYDQILENVNPYGES